VRAVSFVKKCTTSFLSRSIENRYFSIDRERMDGIFKLFVSRGKGWRF